MKTYDCFTFFNELDLLEIRLEELYDYVDYFVIVEMDKTHSGASKPLYFEENKNRFNKYLDKIIHIKLECKIKKDIFEIIPFLNKLKFFRMISNRFDLGKWRRENFQRNGIGGGLINCKDEDLIFVSDLDEIINPKIIKKVKEIFSTKKIKRVALEQKMHLYYLNGKVNLKWIGSKATTYKNLKEHFNNSPQTLRVKKDFFKRITNSDALFLKDGGWHFSYLGGEQKVKEKINSFAESEKIKTGKDFFTFKNKTFKVNYVRLDNSFPKTILKNQKKYSPLILPPQPKKSC